MIIQIDRGEPVDVSAESAGVQRTLRDYLNAAPARKAEVRAHLKQLAAPVGIKRGEAFQPSDAPLMGTTFIGGAGLAGDYIADMLDALREAGIAHVRAADPEVWSAGMYLDALSSGTTERSRNNAPTDFRRFGTEGEQFNLVGYSWGGLQAAQSAADYADAGGQVDNLVLIGTPVSKEFLEAVQDHPNIASVHVLDLSEVEDPIRAGADFSETLLSVPTSVNQFISDYDPHENAYGGHFYYGDHAPFAEAQRRRRELARELYRRGLR